jgi:hypothetical protein
MTIFYWRARSLYLYCPGTGWPSYTPGHWVPFLSPLTTRRDYGGGILTRLHMGWYHICNKFELFLRSTVSWPGCLGVRPLYWTHDQIFITVRHLQSSCCGAPSLTRGLVCNLLVQFTVMLRSKSQRTRDHVSPSHLRLCSLFVASYDSQGYSGGILTRLHKAAIATKSKSKFILLTHEALNLFIWRCATEHSSSCL